MSCMGPQIQKISGKTQGEEILIKTTIYGLGSEDRWPRFKSQLYPVPAWPPSKGKKFSYSPRPGLCHL